MLHVKNIKFSAKELYFLFVQDYLPKFILGLVFRGLGPEAM